MAMEIQYRCRLCKMAFLAPEFAAKHVQEAHAVMSERDCIG
jgi:uncharacterized C2H2 Zn-finger protein